MNRSDRLLNEENVLVTGNILNVLYRSLAHSLPENHNRRILYVKLLGLMDNCVLSTEGALLSSDLGEIFAQLSIPCPNLRATIAYAWGSLPENKLLGVMEIGDAIRVQTVDL